MGPQDKIIMDGQKERQGDFVFTATDVGEYRFCFNNQMSTFAEKFIDFEIAVRAMSISPVLPLFMLTATWNRLNTNNEPQSPPNKAHPPSRPRPSKNPSSSSPASYQPSLAIRNISARERIVTSAPLGVQRGGFSTLV